MIGKECWKKKITLPVSELSKSVFPTHWISSTGWATWIVYRAIPFSCGFQVSLSLISDAMTMLVIKMQSMGSSYALTVHLRGTKMAPIWKKKQYIPLPPPLPPYSKYVRYPLFRLCSSLILDESATFWSSPTRAWRHGHQLHNLLVCKKHKFILFATKFSKERQELEAAPLNGLERMGTVAGAVALIIGTSIGSGILALPKETSPAVLLFPQNHCFCWHKVVQFN